MIKKGSVLNREYILTDWGATALIHRYPEESFGSLHFTAPERLWGQVGYKSDLFSLGIVSFYILTGTVPYDGENGEEYCRNVIEKDGISPSEKIPQIPSGLDKIVRDLIRHSPQARPEPSDISKRIEKLKTYG